MKLKLKMGFTPTQKAVMRNVSEVRNAEKLEVKSEMGAKSMEIEEGLE